MEAITIQEALELSSAPSITKEAVHAAHKAQEGTFEVVSVTKVKTAAKFKSETIQKVSRSIAILPESGDTYRNMVIESAKSLGKDVVEAESFAVSDSFYEHTECYPVCKAKSGDTLYLYGIYMESSKPVYIKDGEQLSKEDVAEYLTPAEAKKLLGEAAPSITENKANNLSHDVKPRTTKLENIRSITRI